MPLQLQTQTLTNAKKLPNSEFMKCIRRFILAAMVALLGIILITYIFSRVAAPTRLIQTHHIEGSAAAGETLDTFRVAAYNIAHGRGLAESNWDGGSASDRMERLKAIAELLREIDADIVVLNEVDFNCSWSNGVNQAEVLAELAGYPIRIEQRNLDFRVLWFRWDFGNAILSRLPISNGPTLVGLPGYDHWETRLAGQKQAVWCSFRSGDKEIPILAAHLCHRSEDVRVDSVDALKPFTPCVIAGDLNSTPPDFPNSGTDSEGQNAIAKLDSLTSLQRTPKTAPAAAGRTFRSYNPVSTIDWIFIPNGWQYTNYRVIDSELSDHRPVVADVEY